VTDSKGYLLSVSDWANKMMIYSVEVSRSSQTTGNRNVIAGRGGGGFIFRCQHKTTRDARFWCLAPFARAQTSTESGRLT
jgi:hypothetical protein